MKLAGSKSALNPAVIYSTDRSKAVVPVLVLLFVALWFILRGDLFYVLLCIILVLCFSVVLALRLPRLGKREIILVLFVRLFDLCSFGFVGFLFLLVSRKGCGLWLWHSLDFSFTCFWSLVNSLLRFSHLRLSSLDAPCLLLSKNVRDFVAVFFKYFYENLSSSFPVCTETLGPPDTYG